MLLEAIDKIKAYDRLYRIKQTDPKYLKTVEIVQNKQFEKIQLSCGEHAIISLATSFETYYKELLQQLLFQFQHYFISKQTVYSAKLAELLNSEHPVNYEFIESKLSLRNRFEYYDFLKAHDISFLSPDEATFIEYIYLKRNSYVHNAGRVDSKTQKKLDTITPPITENIISTEAKRLRTKLKKIVFKLHDRIFSNLNQ